MKVSDHPKPIKQRVLLPPSVKEAMLRFIKSVAESDAQHDHGAKAKE
jgi:hypothetical protein